MKDVGDKFGRGRADLAVRAAVGRSDEEGRRAPRAVPRDAPKASTKGKIVLATVFGDVHDIGKNLVNTILTNNGYTVYDLGKQVPMNAILEKAVEVGADAIGLSALLVSTSKQMPICVQEQDARGLRVSGRRRRRRDQPRLRPAHRVRSTKASAIFEPGVFYAKDAFEGLDIMDALTRRPDRATRCAIRVLDEARTRARTRAHRACPSCRDGAHRARSTLAYGDPPRAAVLGRAYDRRRRRARALAVLRSQEPLPALVGRRQRQGRASGSTLVREEFEPRWRAYQRASRSAAACSRRKRRVRLFPGGRPRRRRDRLRSARPRARDRALRLHRGRSAASICAWPTTCANRDDGGGASDVIALQVVTMGRDVSHASTRCKPRATTASRTSCTASRCNRPRRWPRRCTAASARELGLDAGARQALQVGLRRVSRPLAARDRVASARCENAIGTELTEAFQIVPEQSTAAIVIHHPQAAYFNAGAVRELTPA